MLRYMQMPLEITDAAPGTRVAVKKSKRNKIICNNIPKPLSNRCFTAIVSGKPNSGKSVLIDSLMGKQYRHCFTSVILVCPETSRQCFENSVFEGMDPDHNTLRWIRPNDVPWVVRRTYLG